MRVRTPKSAVESMTNAPSIVPVSVAGVGCSARALPARAECTLVDVVDVTENGVWVDRKGPLHCMHGRNGGCPSPVGVVCCVYNPASCTTTSV